MPMRNRIEGSSGATNKWNWTFIFLALIQGCSKFRGETPKKLHIATWSNYADPTLVSAFKAKTGIDVEVDVYETNEELVQKLRSGASDFDLVYPTDYAADRLVREKLLQPLAQDQISHLESLIDPSLLKLKKQESQEKYTLPFVWGTTGFIYQKKSFRVPPKSFKNLFSASQSHNSFTLLNDEREPLSLALKMNGKSLNTINATELNQASNVLSGLAMRSKGFENNPWSFLEEGALSFAQVYSTDALLFCSHTNNRFAYFVPEEGSTLWLDHIGLVVGTQHSGEAYEWIHYLYNPENYTPFVKRIFGGSVLRASRLTSGTDLPAEQIFSDRLFIKNEQMHDLKAGTKIWEQAWKRVNLYSR